MPLTRFDIISIGTLSRNRLWGETEAVRTAHATTTLIRSGERKILVDPGLPSIALAARLYERTGIRIGEIDTVFLTNFKRAHRGGLEAFAEAKLLMHDVERQYERARTEKVLGLATEEEEREALQNDLELLDRVGEVEDKIAHGVDLFPLFGYTAGTCGLLISLPTTTVLIAGDAVVTQDHFLAGQVLADSADLKMAQDSMAEVYEIADLIVPGHDNLFVNPRTQGI
jgi:glyoxylase-like metal-dependent hydrolase (beta-lactamase superfamily II)